MQPIQPGPSFKENLALLPGIDGLERIELIGSTGESVASIPNEPGKQGSLALYHYLGLCFGRIDRTAAEHGLLVFGEHTADAQRHPGAHPNIDRLLEIVAGSGALNLHVIARS